MINITYQNGQLYLNRDTLLQLSIVNKNSNEETSVMIFTKYDLKIFSAFCKIAQTSSSANQITIPKIAKELGISRQAVYKSHYKNIDEIIHALHLYIEEDIQTDFKTAAHETNKSFDIIYFISYDILPKLYQKREYLKVLYGTTVDPSWHNFLTERYTKLIQNILNLEHKKISEEYTEFIVAQSLAIIGVWMRSEEIELPIYFSKKFHFLMKNSISDILKIDNFFLS